MPRCGRCDTNRLVELPDGRVMRCPRCHPLGDPNVVIKCRHHPEEAAETCRRCLAPIVTTKGRRAKPKASPPTAPSCPHGTAVGATCLACRRMPPATEEVRRARVGR